MAKNENLELAQYAACLLILKTGKDTHIFQTPDGSYIVDQNMITVSMDGEPLEFIETVSGIIICRKNQN